MRKKRENLRAELMAKIMSVSRGSPRAVRTSAQLWGSYAEGECV